MNKLKILALLVIVAFVVQDVVDGFRQVTDDGWKPASGNKEYNAHFELSVRPGDTFVPDSLLSGGADGVKAPYWATHIEAYGSIKPSVLQRVGLSLFILVGLLVCYGIYCLVRLVIAVLRGSVFMRKNVRRMRFFVYSILALGLLTELMHWISYRAVVESVSIPGYEVVYDGLTFVWLPYLLLALFTEVFAIGVKLKEEQDLTI